MTFTSNPRLRSLEYMMRQVPRYRPDPAEQRVPVFHIGAYGDYLRMLPYFDYDGFGEHMAELYDGKFVDSGFVCMDQDRYLENILADVQNEGIGGI